MKNIILSFCILLLVFSCKKTDSPEQVCYVSNPIVDIEWLKEIKYYFDIDMTQFRQSITQYIYNNEYVFAINNCIGCNDAMIMVYDCEKNEVCRFGGIAGFNTCPDFESTATNETILYNQ